MRLPYLLSLVLPALTVISLFSSSCTHRSGGAQGGDSDSVGAAGERGDAAGGFVTDSIVWQDSILSGNSKANVSMNVECPSEANTPLTRNVRQWIASQLYTGIIADSAGYRNCKPMGSATSLVKRAGDMYLDVAASEIEDFDSAMVEFSINYEYDIRIHPELVTPRFVTYYSMRYLYTGGAHGGTLTAGQTFAASTGEMLTLDNMFKKGSLGALLTVVKEQIFKQYFLPQLDESGDGGKGMTLGDCLLFPADEMQLPAGTPYFTKDGVMFEYQQYEIAPYAAGLPSCCIPYAMLEDMLTPLAKELVP